MTDPIAALLRAASEVAGEADLAPDPVAAVRSRVARHRSRRRARVAGLAAAAALVAATAVLVATSGGGEPEGVATAPDPTTTTTAADVDPYGDVPPAPLDPRRQPAVAPVGAEAVVVWGGFRSGAEVMSDGAVYDRRSDRWTRLAPSPLAEDPPSSYAPIAAPVDGGVVVARDRSVARWDRATDRWTELDDAPAPVTHLVAVGDDRLVAVGTTAAVLDVGTGRWAEPTALPPFDVDAQAAVWTGTQVLVLGSSPGGPPDRLAMVGFDPEAVQWVDVPEAPSTEVRGTGVTATWDGERVVVADHEGRAATYDPAAGTWAELPVVPARFAEHHPSMASVGGHIVISMARTVAVLGGERQVWTPFPSPTPNDTGVQPGQGLVPVDDTTLALWVDDAGLGRPDLVLFDPTTLAGRDRRRQVGGASVVTAGDEYVQGGFLSEGAVVVDLLTAAGEHCRVTSGIGQPLGDAGQRAVREEVPIDDPASRRPSLIWFHDEAATRWEAEIDDGDLFVVDCDDEGAARRVVGSVSVT